MGSGNQVLFNLWNSPNSFPIICSFVAVWPTWKGIFYSSFSFFAHIRTTITKSTSLLFHAGNSAGRFYLWRTGQCFQFTQFSNLPTYLFLRHMQLVNPQPRTKTWKIFDISHSCTRLFWQFLYRCMCRCMVGFKMQRKKEGRWMRYFMHYGWLCQDPGKM